MENSLKIRCLSKQPGGFSLIEVMIAMALFSIGLLAVASLQGANVKNNTTGNITTQAAMLARAKIEELKSMDISALTAGEYEDADQIDADGNAGGIYKREWQIENAATDLRRIQVSVSWNRAGQSRAVSLTTVTRGGGV
jgi:prepilin-type N-terminal cleavage/methylation domain-containing protein